MYLSMFQSPVQESALSTRSGSIPESSSDGNTECSPKLFAHGRVLHDADQPLDSIGVSNIPHCNCYPKIKEVRLLSVFSV